VVPLLGWYHHKFDGLSTPESLNASRKGFGDFTSCTWPDGIETETLESTFADMNQPWVDASYDAPVITASHFLPRPELMPPRKSWGRKAYICDAVGSHLLEGQLRRLGAKMHIFGHTHISWDGYYDGVHYMQNAVRYPQERIAWKSRVDEIQTSTDLRNILVWASNDPSNFCPWPGRCGKCERSAPPDAQVCPPSRVAPDQIADSRRFVYTLPAVTYGIGDDEKHLWATVPLPAGWPQLYGSGSLTVRWRDQGWGSQKGMLWGRLVVAGSPSVSPAWIPLSTHFAPQRWVEESFQLPPSWFPHGAGAVSLAAVPGGRATPTALELGYVVGSKEDGTGHQLQVQDGGVLVLEPR